VVVAHPGVQRALDAAPFTPASDPDLVPWQARLREAGRDNLVLFPEGGGAEAIETALTTAAQAPALLRVLMDPTSYCRAVPSLVTCREISSAQETDGRWRRLVAWELEIPLSNLSGKLEAVPDPDWMGVRLRFVSGDLAPGVLRFRWRANPAAPTLVWASLAADLRGASWLLARLARRDPWTEPAMRATIVWIAAQALASLAAAPPGTSTGPRPSGPMSPWTRRVPEDAATSDEPLASVARAEGSWLSVARTATGRLQVVQVARRWPGEANEVAPRLASERVFGAWVGWNHLQVDAHAPDHALVDVRDAVPFVDLSARWAIAYGPPLTGEATSGATAGARWRLSLAHLSPRSALVFSLSPRLAAAGWVPRRFIEAEPLLEHGLALALAYVDMRAMEAALLSGKSPR